MRAITASELLEIWEYGAGQASNQRALQLLEAAFPTTSREALAALSVGERDARMLMLREQLWGPEMVGFAVCPGCRERLELPLNAAEMLAAAGQAAPRELSLSVDGYTTTFRLPTSQDMIAASRSADFDDARLVILERCLISARLGGEPIHANCLPEEVVAEIAQCMEEADPLANIQIRLSCPCCDHRWRAAFDIASFLWKEIEVWARRAVSDVHTLATAYGWSEREVLSLSPVRRQMYLEMVGT